MQWRNASRQRYCGDVEMTTASSEFAKAAPRIETRPPIDGDNTISLYQQPSPDTFPAHTWPAPVAAPSCADGSCLPSHIASRATITYPWFEPPESIRAQMPAAPSRCAQCRISPRARIVRWLHRPAGIASAVRMWRDRIWIFRHPRDSSSGAEKWLMTFYYCCILPGGVEMHY
jgi:hypothetical protein